MKWTVTKARERFSELLRKTAVEAQPIYRRDKLIAAVIRAPRRPQPPRQPLGALAGIIVGILAGAILFAESKLAEPFITSPYLASFLHRTFLCAVLSAGAMFAVSHATPPPREEVLAGAFYLFGDWESRKEKSRGYLVGAAALFIVVAVLWYVFR